MRKLTRLIAMASGMVVATAAGAAETVVDYKGEQGYHSNLFDGPERLDGYVFVGEVALRGTQSFDGGTASLRLSHLERRMPRYRFADTHETVAELGLAVDATETTQWTIELRGSRSETGDLLALVSTVPLGYRNTSYRLQGGAGVTTTQFGGSTSLTAKLSGERNGKVDFKPDLLLPARLDADEALLDVMGKHVVALLGGEAGVAINYRRLFVPEDQRDLYLRYPASALRGTIAYGREVGHGITALVEFGATALAGPDVGASLHRARPYLRTEVEWQMADWLALGASYRQDYALSDVDDPIGEFVRQTQVLVRTKPAEGIGFDLALEQLRRDWIYYDYASKDRYLTATLTFDVGHERKLALEYVRRLHTEADAAEDYDDTSVVTRLSGSF
ncbi:hypothetical protein [Rhizobium halophytocola]|uniref:Porin n=1 Tax=Rhizobium halophytocola TaxID=735519 RepID=A0ABS4DTF6_9HYPH|nr:hypothetical protein [Rhizobium halophytocola]MBP1848983.1 hypothetical protein [Rhizobium halophytocola]